MLQKSLFQLILFIGVLALGLVGCGEPRQTSNQEQPEEDGPPLIAQQFSIKAETGGAAQLNLGDGSRAKIVFPQDSLQSDTALSIAPLYTQGDDILSGGFSLTESDSDQGPALNYPAIIIFYADKDMGQDVSIVRYLEDGSYEVIPTTVSVADGKTALMAEVDHFSDYGAKKITPAERESARDEQTEDFNWVIYVNDSADVDSGSMKRKITLDFKAVNTSGGLGGQYTGYAHAKTTNDMEAMGGKLDANFQITDENVSFELSPYVELASLTPDEDLPLAPLEPEKMPDLMGQGTLHMTGAGSGTIQIGAYGGSRSINAEASSDPFTVVVTDHLVRLTVEIAGVGTTYFDGYIRGEGR